MSFGDRKTKDGASLYLKNLNNITQEMQIEILKRDKLDYVFQSLSVISVLPVLFIEPLKAWSLSNFSFTTSFYNGKIGLIIQILLVVLTLVCYLLVRKVKDTTGSTMVNSQNPWQQKVYKIPFIKKFVDLFIPKKGTKQYRTLTQLLKDAASKQKMEWIYVTKLMLVSVVFVLSILLMNKVHKVAIDYIYTEPTANYNMLTMSEKQEEEAKRTTLRENKILDKFRGQTDVSETQIRSAVKFSEDYKDATAKEIDTAVSSIYTKLQTINSEYIKWFEVLIALVFATLRIHVTNMDIIFPEAIKTARNGRRGYAVSNNYTYAYEN